MKLRMMELRKAAGFDSREDFAKAVHMTERKIKAIERGESRMILEDACIIADALKCTLDELVGREVPPVAHTDNHKHTKERELLSSYRGFSASDKRAVDSYVQGIAVHYRAHDKSNSSCGMENIA